jgi:hypothetical protein
MSIHVRYIAVMMVLVGASLVSVTGCGTRRPNLRHPGPTLYQRYNATLHDPYPDNDAGPAVEGGRPMAFEKPLAEPVRSRWLRDNWWAQ